MSATGPRLLTKAFIYIGIASGGAKKAIAVKLRMCDRSSAETDRQALDGQFKSGSFTKLYSITECCYL